MFAYVRYTDGYKTIVPISFIKNFDIKTYQKDVLYPILWEDDYFNGQILLVKETREEIEESTDNPSKRIRVPKIHLGEDALVEKNEDDLKKRAKAMKVAEGVEKRKSLMQIMAEKKAMKKKSPLFATNKKRKREETLEDIFSDSDGDEGVVPQKIYDELRLKYQHMQNKKDDLKQELDHYKQKSAQLETCKCELEQELATYRNANLTLQQNLDELLKSVLSQMTSKPATAPLTSTANSTSESASLQPTPMPSLLEKKDGKIHIGRGIWLREEVWKKINSTTKDSLFVKELAVTIWGTVELRGRSVSGKECPTKNTQAKPPLTPAKLATLRECFHGWLIAQNVEETEREKREKLVGYYISQKIQDLVKKEKKQCTEIA